MNLKKLLIILIIVFAVVLTALVIYNIMMKDDAETISDESPTTHQYADYGGTIQALSQQPVLSAALDGRRVKYYLKDGQVWQADLGDSSSQQISAAELADLIKVIWSPDRSKVVSIFHIGGLTKKYIYDHSSETSIPLSEYIQWTAWSPDSSQIAYQYYNSSSETNNISIANSTASQWTSILRTRMKDVIIEWPRSDRLSVRTKPSGLAQSVVYTIDLDNNDFQKVVEETYGLSALWSPQGDKILFSSTNTQGKNVSLKVADLGRQLTYDADVDTLPEKCVWSQDNRTVFCAVPGTIPSSAVLPDDYYKKTVFFDDSLWRINLDTGEAVRLIESTTYDMSDLQLPSLEDYLIFINRKDGLLYSLSL